MICISTRIAARRASLSEIEGIVADAKTMMERGEISRDNIPKWELAEQGDQLMERVEKARTIYDDLDEVWNNEKGQREISNNSLWLLFGGIGTGSTP